jgi:dTDP-3-amino-3,4,6-trideoxy-alpha-D-glucose transaminase
VYAQAVAHALARVQVPFVDLWRSHKPLRDVLLTEISELLESSAFINGPQVAAFERAFADYCGTEHAVGVASGLDALRLALITAGLEPGDEVIMPASTFVATFEAVTQAGGVPVPVDVSDADYNLDAEQAAGAITPRTRFLMPVHLYGQMADMRTLGELATRHRLAIIEDACQAHGAERDGVRAGQGGLAAAFSFYPAKNLGAFGDAGALVTDDERLAGEVRKLREHGQRGKYEHELEGYTARLDTLQALVLLRKLPLLDGWNEERRAAAAFYADRLTGVGDLVLPQVARDSKPVWHLYVVRTAEPAQLADALRAQGIATGRHYPIPPHLSPAYESLELGPGSFPVAETLAEQALSLPLFPGITDAQLSAVVEAVAAFFDGG